MSGADSGMDSPRTPPQNPGPGGGGARGGEGAETRPVVLVVVGTRPEAIKMAPVLEAFRARADEVDTRLVLTGQHDDLVAQVLEVFGAEADVDLALMKPGQTLYDVAHGALAGLGRVIRETGASALLVQGDTASVCFGALAGFFEKIRVGHVEAGLRSHDRWAPWPEEIFRRLTDVLTEWYFAPTPEAARNLLAENLPPGRIEVTGNTVVDALQRIAGGDRPFRDPALAAAEASGRRLVLLTAHRRESFGAPLREIFGAVRRIADEHEDVEIVYPVHPNPKVKGPAHELLAGHPRIRLTDPVDYFDLVRALSSAALVLTDSGGIQEEAPSFGTPVLVLREVTERPEGVEAGVARLVGHDAEEIVRSASRVLAAPPRPPADRGAGATAGTPTASRPAVNPYGDGRAAERIADLVIADLTGAPRRTTAWQPLDTRAFDAPSHQDVPLEERTVEGRTGI